MPARKSPAVELAEKMIQVLEAQRSLGPDSYPTTLQRLAELAGAAATEDLILKASTAKPFKERAVVAMPKNPKTLVALAEDQDALLRGDKLLMDLLEAACSPTQPTADPTKLKAKLASKLKTAFDAALKQRLDANDLPNGVAIVTIKKKPRLHLTRYPLPREPVAALADQLVATLREWKTRGAGHYPAPFSRLLELAAGGSDPKTMTKAVALPAFANSIVLAFKTKPKTGSDDRPIALAEDGALLAKSTLVLETCIRRSRTEATHGCNVAAAKKHLTPALLDEFTSHLEQCIASKTLPATVGCLRVSKKHLLFLMVDARGGTTAPPQPRSEAEPRRETEPAPDIGTTSPPDFVATFERAFAKLEGQGSRGGNFVNLHSLRQALPFSRVEFDRGLQSLRSAGRFGLSATEDPSLLSPEERAAAIEEDGQWLLYVSRKNS